MKIWNSLLNIIFCIVFMKNVSHWLLRMMSGIVLSIDVYLINVYSVGFNGKIGHFDVLLKKKLFLRLHLEKENIDDVKAQV